MGLKKKKGFIVYFSPAGSTRHVAEVIEKQFLTLGAEVSSFDLAECSKDVATVISHQMEASNGKSCLFVGSPVYVSHAVPPVMEFIAELKEDIGAFAVPFVTWGGACSGISLYEMGKELIGRGFTLLGAAKILALHSLMWKLDDPLGKGHPDADDDRMVAELVNHVNQQTQVDSSKGIKLSDLAYQTRENHKEMEKISLQTAKAHMPERTIDTERCNQCEVCSDVCPADAVTFTPYPEFEDGCVFCFTCMKECPEKAINVDLSGIWQRIRDRAAFFSERPYTQVFYS
ncbi:MAG TPA: EFR1 family ferrodoxin [Desulfobacterales bacterium]|nr:EFR1 family ferrodoxin [Desulfobacterales bacterium]